MKGQGCNSVEKSNKNLIANTSCSGFASERSFSCAYYLRLPKESLREDDPEMPPEGREGLVFTPP